MHLASLQLTTSPCSHPAGFSAEQLASTLWALANLNYIPGSPLLEAAATALLSNLALCAPKQAAQVRGMPPWFFM